MFYTWKKFSDPSTGWLASKTADWTADSFSGGLEVDFSAIAPAGTKAARIVIANDTAAGSVYQRKSGDTNISNTPHASAEYSHIAFRVPLTSSCYIQIVVWLSIAYKAQFAITDIVQDLYVAYPAEHMGCPEPLRLPSRYYLKEYADGWEYSPVGRSVSEAKLNAGFIVVDRIPQRILDRHPGGKDYVEPEDPRDVKLRELEARIQQLESRR